jgi:mannitol-1-phosphate 5-dehydrogenase
MKACQSEKSIVIFGAGKIGRSFIGQLFGRTGYKVIFIDVDHRIINELNKRKKYKVVIKYDRDEVLEVTDVCGVQVDDYDEVMNVITDCSIMATCVGKNAFEKILPLIAKGIEKRFSSRPDYPLDIILAENIRDASPLMKRGFSDLMAKDFPIDSYIGFIETSIGKMVPIMPKEIESKDPLLVYAEPYNTLILDKNGFKNPIPNVEGLSPKENIKAWVDRKAFIHNLGHVAAAYFGHYKYPGRKYIYEVLADPEVNSFTRHVMKQSAKALIIEYPNEFTENDLDLHINDLISRFQNKALGDTVYRVGHDLKRKLNVGDRIGGAIKLAQKTDVPFDKLIEVFTYGVLFFAPDEFNNLDLEDKQFLEEFEMDAAKVLTSICGFNFQADKITISAIMNKYKSLPKKEFIIAYELFKKANTCNSKKKS